MTFLLITIDSSHQPIITALCEARRDFTVFFCTDRDAATGRAGSRAQIEGKGLRTQAKPNDDKPTLPNIRSFFDNLDRHPPQQRYSKKEIDAYLAKERASWDWFMKNLLGQLHSHLPHSTNLTVG